MPWIITYSFQNAIHCKIIIICCGLIFPETGGICITPRPSEPDAEIIPAMPMRPFFGIKPSLMDDKVNVFLSLFRVLHLFLYMPRVSLLSGPF